MSSAPNPRPRSRARRQSTVASGFVTGMLSGLRRRRVDPGPLLAAAGLGPHPPGAADRVPVQSYSALYNAVVRSLDDEGFALFSVPMRFGTFEFLCRACLGAGSLEEALERAARFLRVVLPDLGVSVRREGNTARIEIDERRCLAPAAGDPGRVFAFEWLLRLLHGLACWLVDRGFALESVAFPYPRPAHADDYGLVYTEHSTFDARTLVATFDAAVLGLPVRRDESDLRAFLEGAPGRISVLYRRDRETARVVRALLARALPGPYSLEDAARELHLSARSLHRRLHEEGASFRRIKDALRRDLALEHLEKSRASIARIAGELGYTEPSAFFRAFRHWTGEAPTRYRRRRMPRGSTE